MYHVQNEGSARRWHRTVPIKIKELPQHRDSSPKVKSKISVACSLCLFSFQIPKTKGKVQIKKSSQSHSFQKHYIIFGMNTFINRKYPRAPTSKEIRITRIANLLDFMVFHPILFFNFYLQANYKTSLS